MTEAGTWPERNAVYDWVEKHKTMQFLETKEIIELCKAVTAPRIEQQKRADKAESALREIAHYMWEGGDYGSMGDAYQMLKRIAKEALGEV